LWSLWDMIRFAPDEFLNLSAFLELMAIPGDLDLTRLRSLKQFDMQELKESARKLGLQVTVKHTLRANKISDCSRIRPLSILTK
jgi:hypothetical protein